MLAACSGSGPIPHLSLDKAHTLSLLRQIQQEALLLAALNHQCFLAGGVFWAAVAATALAGSAGSGSGSTQQPATPGGVKTSSVHRELAAHLVVLSSDHQCVSNVVGMHHKQPNHTPAAMQHRQRGGCDSSGSSASPALPAASVQQPTPWMGPKANLSPLLTTALLHERTAYPWAAYSLPHSLENGANGVSKDEGEGEHDGRKGEPGLCDVDLQQEKAQAGRHRVFPLSAAACVAVGLTKAGGRC